MDEFVDVVYEEVVGELCWDGDGKVGGCGG